MSKVLDIYNYIDSFAPYSTAAAWDNPGIAVWDRDAAVTGVLLALDVTPQVLCEAMERGANLIVTHHPLLFHPAKRICSDDLVYQLIRAGISALSAHTNLDCACGGVNDVLAGLLGLEGIEPMPDGDPTPDMGRIGLLPQALEPEKFAAFVKERLALPSVCYIDGGRPVRRVAVLGGAGGSLLDCALAAGADAYVTGEARHDELLRAAQRGLTLVPAGHFATEYPVMEVLKQKLEAHFTDLWVEHAAADTDAARHL